MKIRLLHSYLYVLCIFLTVPISTASAQQKITDTIYYDLTWRICEEPIAAYYRTGTLALMNSIWYFTGQVKDYTIKNELMMEGVYSDSVKNGLFKFYYNDRKLLAEGDYQDGLMVRTWHWYYANGKEKAQIYFNSGDLDFKFITFKDENGKILMEKGISDFIWPTNIFEPAIHFIVKGSFNEGRRSGKWKFESSNGSTMFNFTEWYDEGGKIKKSKYDVSEALRPLVPFEFNFSPYRLETMESIAYNNYFRLNGDSLSGQALLNYLAHHKATEIKVKNKNFDSAYSFIINSLFARTGRFDYKSKDIDADIEFKLGPKGFPEDITLTGNGISEDEKKFLRFLISKFTNIEMPGTATIAIEGYHHIYMYNIDISVYFPINAQRYVGQELFFSPLTKKQMLASLNEHKKDIKKYLRKILNN